MKAAAETTSKRELLSLSLAFSGLLIAFYSQFASFTIQEADAAEFVTLGVIGGIAHPPGYPCYILLLKLWHFFFHSVPPEVSFTWLSIILGAGSFLFTSFAVTKLSEMPAFAFASTFLTFSLWPIVRTFTTIEPFALNLFLNCTAIFVLVEIYLSPRLPYFFALGLIYGLGAANHHTLVFTLPIVLAALYLVHVKKISWLRSGAVFILGNILGFACYLSIFLPVSTLETSWGDWSNPTLNGFLNHFLRREYGTFQLQNDSTGFAVFGLLFLLENFLIAFREIGLALIALLLFSSKNQRLIRFVAIACFVLTGPVFFALFNNSDNLASREISTRFIYLPMFWAFFCINFVVIDLLKQKKRWLPFLALATLCLLTINNLPKADRSRQTFFQAYLETFPKLDSNTVIVTYDDPGIFGSYYLKYVRKSIKSRLFHHEISSLPWYLARKQKELTVTINPQNIWPFYETLLQSHQVLFQYPNSTTLSVFSNRIYPRGPFLQLKSNDGLLPPPSYLLSQQLIYMSELFGNEMLIKSEYLNHWEKSILYALATNIKSFVDIAVELNDEDLAKVSIPVLQQLNQIISTRAPEFLWFKSGA